MDEFINIRAEVKRHYSARASLAALGVKVQQLQVFEPVRQQVKIGQKTVKYSPSDKLYDGLIAILAGAHGLVEINKRVRAEPGVQMAFGRTGCAEQWVVQDTLDACTAENVHQMETALDDIYRRHSRGYSHNYGRHLLLLDIDLTRRRCGRKAAFASKGYFAKQRNRHGRQVGYVVATPYEEIVAERLFAGQSQLTTALQPLVRGQLYPAPTLYCGTSLHPGVSYFSYFRG